MIRSASASSSAAVPSAKDASRASSSRSTARTAAGEASRVRAATTCRARVIASSHAPRSTGLRSTVTAPVRTPAAHSSERSRKSAGSNTASAMPSFAARGPDVIRFWDSAFSTITETAASMPIRSGRSWVPPQPGTRPRKTSGKATNAPPEMVRCWACSASSSPPPRAAPLTKANVGTAASRSRANTRWPCRAISRASSREEIRGTPERSAPTANTNGLPVIAMPATSAASAWSRAASSEASPPGPKVEGRVWSCPLSRVISARGLSTPGRVTSRVSACVTTSSGNCSLTSRPPRQGSPR
ncbi:unannotated protein [freshwater metagenome]|uniref:Unannotated protein n=1 Tax=freshwater metagenome TaxID=449393 RepID=A0A6J7GNY3_9ZZZZ